jgi:hypothetical protein
MKTIQGKTEVYDYEKPDSALKAILVIISPLIAPFILFSKFMYKIKRITITIEYE